MAAVQELAELALHNNSTLVVVSVKAEEVALVDTLVSGQKDTQQ